MGPLIRRDSQAPSSHASSPPMAIAAASRPMSGTHCSRTTSRGFATMNVPSAGAPCSRRSGCETARNVCRRPGGRNSNDTGLSAATTSSGTADSGEPREPRVLPREERRPDVEQLVAGRELERIGGEVRRRGAFVDRAEGGGPVEPRDAARLACELLVRGVPGVALEELHGDRGRDDAGDHDPEQEQGRQPKAQRAGHLPEGYVARQITATPRRAGREPR